MMGVSMHMINSLFCRRFTDPESQVIISKHSNETIQNNNSRKYNVKIAHFVYFGSIYTAIRHRQRSQRKYRQ
jgi:hypothetical protein